MTIPRAFFIGVAVSTIGASLATAQGGTVRGVARSAGDTTVVARATAEIVEAQRRQLTDSLGAFTFSALKPGRYQLRLRRLGYEPFVRYVEVSADSAVTYSVPMRAIPRQLKEIVIAGKTMHVPPRLADVYRRGASGFGHFITRGDIDRRNPFWTREIFNGLPGIFVDNSKVRFRRCGDPNNAGVNFENAKVQVYIDGNRVTRLTQSVDGALASVHPREIEAIEIYEGVAQIPAEFLEDACAVIAIWTKRD